MAKTKSSNQTSSQMLQYGDKAVALSRIKLAALCVIGAVLLFLLLALFSYHHQDPSLTQTIQPATEVQNYGGIVGAYAADLILSIFGVFGFLLPFVIVFGIWVTFLEDYSFAESSIGLMLLRILGFILLFIGGSSIANILFQPISGSLPQGSGGILGGLIAQYADAYFGVVGSILLLIVVLLLGLTFMSGTLWLTGIVNLGQGIQKMSRLIKQFIMWSIKNIKTTTISIGQLWKQWRLKKKHQTMNKKNQTHGQQSDETETSRVSEHQHIIYQQPKQPTVDAECSDELDTMASINMPEITIPSKQPFAPQQVSSTAQTTHSSDQLADDGHTTQDSKIELTQQQTQQVQAYDDTLQQMPQVNETNDSEKHAVQQAKPTLALLDTPQPTSNGITQDKLDQMADLLAEQLNNFGVSAEVVGSFPGPVITRFEIELGPGVKVSKLSGLSQDLARALSVTGVRIVEVIPGRPYVGIEVPNEHREMVYLQEIMQDPNFSKQNSALTMGLGKDIAGKPISANLGKMPHLLVAGTTGSGKSVGVNGMILSMLYKGKPDDLRFIMIDPKMLELSIYEDIPHLLTPVVTDMNEAANSLKWCVKEMDRRYALMSAAGVRNISSLNDKIVKADQAGQPMKDPLWLKQNKDQDPTEAPVLEKLPYIVVVADEFADMIMVVGKKVEELIARLAQKARAAGIHLILATQRPSADVVTGLIKSNIPARIAFQVSSKNDARIVMDQHGAEQLLGQGDMLYLPPGKNIPMRVHGAFVSDGEVHRVVEACKALGPPSYIDQVTEESGDSETQVDNAEDQDPLYDEAVAIVIETQKASISSVQRRLRVGYNRAARLVESMEAAGVVSAMDNGVRQVLVKKE